MDKFLGRYSEQTYALLRIVAGFLFTCHGAKKILGLFGGDAGINLASKGDIAGLIELIAGVAIMLGFQTGWAAFLSSGLMAFAYFLAHQPEGLWPIENRGELAALYSFLFLFMATRGSGIWSLDRALERRRS